MGSFRYLNSTSGFPSPEVGFFFIWALPTVDLFFRFMIPPSKREFLLTKTIEMLQKHKPPPLFFWICRVSQMCIPSDVDFHADIVTIRGTHKQTASGEIHTSANLLGVTGIKRANTNGL